MDAVVMFEGTIYEDGYGWVAQKVMRDRDLKPQAKAIYSYICSMAGNPNDIDGRKAFPSVSLMKAELGIRSQDTFYKYMNQLKKKGYLYVEQEKENGKFKRNIYKIIAVPQPKEKKEDQDGQEEKPDTEGNSPQSNFSTTGDSPQSNFSTSGKSTSGKSTSENWNSNRNSFNRNSFNRNSNNKDLDLDPIQKQLEILWNLEIPMNLKQKVKIMIEGSPDRFSIQQLIDIQDSYLYQLKMGYVSKDASFEDIDRLNDHEFSIIVEKMLKEVLVIHNMKGLIKDWILRGISYKREDIIGLGNEWNQGEGYYYNWLEDGEGRI